MNDEITPIVLATEFLPMAGMLAKLHSRSGEVHPDQLEVVAVAALYDAIQTRSETTQPFWLHSMTLMDQRLLAVRLSARMAALN